MRDKAFIRESISAADIRRRSSLPLCSAGANAGSVFSLRVANPIHQFAKILFSISTTSAMTMPVCLSSSRMRSKVSQTFVVQIVGGTVTSRFLLSSKTSARQRRARSGSWDCAEPARRGRGRALLWPGPQRKDYRNSSYAAFAGAAFTFPANQRFNAAIQDVAG